MAIKYTVENLDDVPLAIRDEYVKDGDVYKLQVDEVVPKKRLDEFRENKKKVDKELEELRKKYDGVDPEEYKTIKEKFKDIDPDELTTLRQQIEELKGASGKEKAQTKAELEEQIANMSKRQKKELADLTTKYEADLAGLNGKLAQQTAELSKERIDNQIATLAVDNSIRPEALTDVTLRASKVFSLEDGKVIATKPDGSKWISDATDKYLSVAEWFKLLIKDAPHLFKESQGTGSTGNASTKGGGTGKSEGNGENPWKTGNRTQQALIVRADIEKARRLAKEAGLVRIPF